MKKTYKLILLVVIAITLVSIFKRDKHEEYLMNASFEELLSDGPSKDSLALRTIDFAKCDPDDSYEIKNDLGKTSFEIFGLNETGEFCEFQTIITIGSGKNINFCNIPVSIGKVEFTENDFSIFSDYCKYKSE